MPWNMTAINVVSEKLPLDSVADDAKTAVEEAFTFFTENPLGQRLVIPFDTDDARDEAATHIRSYCEARPAGKLTASVWHGYTGVKGEGENAVPVFYARASKGAKTPALSVKVTTYVKKTRITGTPAENTETPAAGDVPPAS